MPKGFYGTYTPRMDDKGRVTLPAKYRESFKNGVMLVRGQDHCIYVFTPEGFEQFAESAINASITDERARGYQRYMLDNPKGDSPAGTTSCAPLFHDIAAYAMRAADVPPSAEPAPIYDLYVDN